MLCRLSYLGAARDVIESGRPAGSKFPVRRRSVGHDGPVLHVRLVVPFSRRHAVLALLDDDPTVCNLVVAGVESVRPAGELVVFDIPSEAANRVLGVLKSVDLDRLGSITVVRIDTSLSAHAEWAEAIAPGDPGEAVVWDEVDARLGLEAHLTPTFLGMMVVAVLIGASALYSLFRNASLA